MTARICLEAAFQARAEHKGHHILQKQTGKDNKKAMRFLTARAAFDPANLGVGMSKYVRSAKAHKRKIAYDRELGEQILQKHPKYIGNPLHKKNPGDFGLTPPSCPSPKKNLCDLVGIFNRRRAQNLLEEGLKRGFLSENSDGGWPRNIWALSAGAIPLEARLDQAAGTYHGFPMSKNDPLYAEILKMWESGNE